MHNRLLQYITNGLFVLAFLSSALGQMGRVTPFPHVHFYIFEPFFFAGVLLLVLQLRTLPFQKIHIMQLAYSASLFLGVLLITFIISLFYFPFQSNTIAALYFIRIFFYVLARPFFFTWVQTHRIPQKTIQTSITYYFIFLVVSGALQYIFYPNLRNLAYAGWDEHYYRIFGTYLEPVVFASIAGLFCWYYISQRLSYTTIAAFLIGTVGILLSFSRAVYVGMGIAGIVFFRSFLNKKLVIGGLLVLAILFILLPKPEGEGGNLFRTSTILSRNQDMKEGLSILAKNPWLGIGYNHIGAVKQPIPSLYGVENNAASSFQNSFLIIAVTAGIGGLLAFINYLRALAKMTPFLTVAILFLSGVSLFDNILLHPFVLMAILFLGASSLTLPSDT